MDIECVDVTTRSHYIGVNTTWNSPKEMLPPALQDTNPLGLLRLLDEEQTRKTVRD